VFISLLRKTIPNEVRLPAYIVIIATFVTVVQLFVAKFLPELDESIGAFIPLIVVNCIILGRAESFASKNNVLMSALDGISMGLGFTLALILLGAIRQFLAEVCLLSFFVSSAGGFMIFGLVMALFNYVITLINNKAFSKKVLLDMQTPVSENAKEVE
jgi:electron transport complex protein RnfE